VSANPSSRSGRRSDAPAQADDSLNGPDSSVGPVGALVPTQAGAELAVGPQQIAAEVGTAENYRERAYAAATLRAYRADWRHFVAYCAARGASALPADPLVVRTYLAVCADRDARKVATLQRRLAAIAYHHREAGHVLDTRDAALRATWRGIRRTHGVAPTEKTAAVTEIVCAMVDALPPSLAGVRDRALILVGFAGAFRRAELVALDLADLLWQEDGVRIVVRSSKTDQEGAGRLKDIPFARHTEHCPVRALREWLELAAIDAGPVFRPLSKTGRVLPRRLTDQWVALAIKQAVTPVAQRQAARAWHRLSHTARARHNQAVWEAAFVTRVVRQHAGHSLRAGFVTSAAAAGARLDEIMDQTGHARVDTVMRYVRNARALRASAAAKLGL
jgi:site-specific recombinase XerD